MFFCCCCCFFPPNLKHATDELVDLLLAVTSIATLDEVVDLLHKPATGAGELEGPEESVGLLEVAADGVDLVDEVLNADDAAGLAESALDDSVVGDGDALAAELGKATLVDEVADGLEAGIPVGDVGLDNAEHGGSGLVETDKDAVVDLSQAEESEDLAGAGADTVDTADADDKGKAGLGLTEEVAVVAGLAAEVDELALLGTVLSGVVLGTLEDDVSLGAELSLGELLGAEEGHELGLRLLVLLDDSLGSRNSGHLCT